MFRLGSRLLLLLLTVGVSVQGWRFPWDPQPQPLPQAQAQTQEDTFTLTILHTNDVHARVEEFDKHGGPCTNSTKLKAGCYGGVARRHSKVQEIRASTDNVLLLDGGDQFQGTLWFVYYGGSAARYFMNLMKYDAMTLGNHEFDRGVEGLVPFLKNVSFPVVSSNIDTTGDDRINGLFNKSVVLEVGGRKVGVVGVTTRQTAELVNPKGVDKLVFQDEVESVQAEVKRLQGEDVNIIIGLSHAGYGVDKEIAARVDGLDVIVGGHTNTFLYTGTPPDIEVPVDGYPTWVVSPSGRQVAVVQDFTFGKYLGQLKVTFNAQGELLPDATTGNPILLDDKVPQDPAILSQLAEWKEPLINTSRIQVGTTYVYLDGYRGVCRTRECNMGNVQTEAMLLATIKVKPPKGDSWSDYSIAILNSGGIRSSIDRGDFNLENVLSVFPFQNTVSLITVKGKDLLRILEHSVANYNTQDPPGAFLQVSGLRIAYNVRRPTGQRVVKVDVLCFNCAVPTFEPLEEDKVYPVVTSDYLINGGDGYKVIGDSLIDMEPLDIPDFVALTEYCLARNPIIQGVDDRIVFVDSDVTGGASVPHTHGVLYTVVVCLLCMVFSI